MFLVFFFPPGSPDGSYSLAVADRSWHCSDRWCNWPPSRYCSGLAVPWKRSQGGVCSRSCKRKCVAGSKTGRVPPIKSLIGFGQISAVGVQIIPRKDQICFRIFAHTQNEWKSDQQPWSNLALLIFIAKANSTKNLSTTFFKPTIQPTSTSLFQNKYKHSFLLERSKSCFPSPLFFHVARRSKFSSMLSSWPRGRRRNGVLRCFEPWASWRFLSFAALPWGFGRLSFSIYVNSMDVLCFLMVSLLSGSFTRWCFSASSALFDSQPSSSNAIRRSQSVQRGQSCWVVEPPALEAPASSISSDSLLVCFRTVIYQVAVQVKSFKTSR